MPTLGHLALVLHAHLPFVRHPEHERFLEEDWFFEAITECYLPLLDVFGRLADDGVPYRVTMVLTPSLLSMFSDPLLCSRYTRHLEEMIGLAEREVERTRSDEELAQLSRFYLERFRHCRYQFQHVHRSNLVDAFGKLQQEGYLELITSAATHAYLPLLQPFPLAVAAQIRTALSFHGSLFGSPPEGFWLPECGYYQGLDAILGSEGVRFFFTDTHGILFARPRPLYGVYAPVLCQPGLAAFGRDRPSSRQVWSSKEGYPGDPEYREFYRDIGFDLAEKDLGPHVQPTGERKNTGIKYLRITGKGKHKELYRPARAKRRAEEHAIHFSTERDTQIRSLAGAMSGGGPPLVVCPYDAELFGHWWFEGPQFLEFLLRHIADHQIDYTCVTPSEYLLEYPVHQQCAPAPSSWGRNGYNEMWLNETNDWVYNHLHWATQEMIRMVSSVRQTDRLTTRALNQAARELMLAQASDWAFIMKAGTTVPYAVKRTLDHLLAFKRLREQVQSEEIDERSLLELEQRHNLFPGMDYRCFREDYGQT